MRALSRDALIDALEHLGQHARRAGDGPGARREEAFELGAGVALAQPGADPRQVGQRRELALWQARDDLVVVGLEEVEGRARRLASRAEPEEQPHGVPRVEAWVERQREQPLRLRGVARHEAAANPIGSFCFWNRTRREIALAPYALGPATATVYAPYLDHDLYDLLSALPAALLVDRTFHTAAIERAFPEHASLGYEGPNARRVDARAQDRHFAGALLRSRWAGRERDHPLLAAGWQRTLRWAASPLGAMRGERHRLEPRLALYLAQLAELGRI